MVVGPRFGRDAALILATAALILANTALNLANKERSWASGERCAAGVGTTSKKLELEYENSSRQYA